MHTAESKTVDLDGPLHYLDFGGAGPAPPLVLVHGLGGSAVNWLALGPLLAQHGRVLALDLPGFGRTPPAGRGMSVEVSAALLLRFLSRVVGGPARLGGNSMGGLISILAAAEEPAAVDRLVLVNPALPRPPETPVDRQVAAVFITYMVPGAGETLLRLRRWTQSPEEAMDRLLRLCGTSAAALSPDVRRAHEALARARRSMAWADGALLEAARSVLRAAGLGRLQRAILAVRAPTLLVHGDQDRLVPVQAARAVAAQRPDWTYRELTGIGHVPQLEIPDRLAGMMQEFFAT